MKASLSTACLYIYPLRWTFAIARRAGFDGVELVISPEIDIRGGAYARKLADEFGLTIFSVHPPMFEYPTWGGVHTSVAPYLTRALRVASDAGAPFLVIHMPKARDQGTGIGHVFVEQVVHARERMNGTGPKLSLENRPNFRMADAGYILTRPDDLRAFADAHDFPMTMDTAHIGTWSLDLLDSLKYFRGRLVNVHLSDLKDVSPNVERMPVLHSYVKQHQFPGEGRLPLVDFLRLLSREGYEGPITFELSPTSLHIWNPRTVLRKLRQSVELVRKATGQV